MASIEERVMKVVAEYLGQDLESVKPESRFVADLGADSIDEVEILIALEDDFDVEISDEVAEEFETVQQVIDYLKQVRP